MVVFVEYVIIDNLIIDYLMLKATFTLTGAPLRKRRLFICSFLGGIIALTYPLMQGLGVLESLIKIFSGLLIVLLASKYKSIKAYYVNAVIFFTFTFLTGGIILGIFSLFNIPTSSEISIALMVIPVYFVFRFFSELIKYFFARKTTQSFIYKVDIKMFDNTLTVKGFMDTGNGLLDGVRPVVVANKRLFYRLLGSNLAKVKLKKLDMITANGKSQNLAVELDELRLYIGQKVNIFNNVTLCVSSQNCGADFDIILHPLLLEVDNENKYDNPIKKIS